MKFTGLLTLVTIVCSASADEHKSGKPGRKMYNSRDRKLGSKSTASPTLSPTLSPTVSPTLSPTLSPTVSPTLSPTVSPTLSPTASKSGKESEDTRTLRRKLHKDRDLVSSVIDPDRIKLRRKINKMRA